MEEEAREGSQRAVAWRIYLLLSYPLATECDMVLYQLLQGQRMRLRCSPLTASCSNYPSTLSLGGGESVDIKIHNIATPSSSTSLSFPPQAALKSKR